MTAIINHNNSDAYYNIYNVKHFGLIADGVTDNSLIFQELINSLPECGARIYFPASILPYYFASEVLFTKNINIYGDGVSAYPIIYGDIDTSNYYSFSKITTDKNIDLFTINSTGLNTTPTCTFKGLHFKNTIASTSGSCIKILGNPINCRFTEVMIEDFYTSIKVDAVMLLHIKDTYFINPINKAIIFDNSISPDYGGLLVYDSYFMANTENSSAILFNSGGGIIIKGNNFNAVEPLHATKVFNNILHIDFTRIGTSEIFITGNRFNNHIGNGIKITNNSSSVGCGIINITTNTFAPSHAAALSAIDIDNVKYVNISDFIGASGVSVAYPFIKANNVTSLRIGIGSQIGWNALRTVAGGSDNKEVTMANL